MRKILRRFLFHRYTQSKTRLTNCRRHQRFFHGFRPFVRRVKILQRWQMPLTKGKLWGRPACVLCPWFSKVCIKRQKAFECKTLKQKKFSFFRRPEAMVLFINNIFSETVSCRLEKTVGLFRRPQDLSKPPNLWENCTIEFNEGATPC